jgi:WD40 repeat protein
MGVVYKARHLKLNRVVALKMILPSHRPEKDTLIRFRTEAEAVARLQHPGIIQIFEIGEHRGLPFFSLEFCPGGSLAKKLGGKPAPPRQSALMVEQLAEGMDAAHQAKVIHRDLKPANVLLAEKWQLKITDFGLAKKLDDTGLTQSGAVLGTPSYMAPEQAAGAVSKIGPATDVYALGAILYELLTGRPPFVAASVMDILLQVVSRDPVPPSQLLPGVPKDLETICLKCLHKDPAARYASAKDLAEDLRRFLNGAPILARPVGRWERTVKWAKRRPAVAGLSSALAAVIVGAFTLVLSALLEATQARDQKEVEEKNATQARALEKAERQKAKEERDRARAYRFTAQLLRVASLWEKAPDAGYELLHNYDECPIDLRDFAWGWYEARCRVQPQREPLKGHKAKILSVAFSPDGKTLACASLNSIKLWDVASGKERASLNGHTDEVFSVAFSPDGKRLASASKHTVKIWDVATGKASISREGSGFGPPLAFSPDGKILASGSLLWDVVSGRERPFLQGLKGGRLLAFSLDGKTLATCANNGTIQLWNVASGQLGASLKGPTTQLSGVAFSPEGDTLATCGDGVIKLWYAHTGQERRSLNNPGGSSVAFSPDGKTLAADSTYSDGGEFKGGIKLWEVASGQERATLKGHTGAVTAVAFSPDGKTLASGSNDKTVRLWEVASGPKLASLPDSDGAMCLAFSPDGKTLLALSWDGTINLWDAASGQKRTSLKGRTGPFQSVAFSPDSKSLAAGSSDRTVTLWDLASAKELTSLKGHTCSVTSVAFSPDGKTLASAGSYIYRKPVEDDMSKVQPGEPAGGTGELKLWDVANRRELTSVSWKGDTGDFYVFSVAFSPDGQTLAAGGKGIIKLCDAANGRARTTLRASVKWPHLWTSTVAYSRDGKLLSLSSYDGSIQLWDVASGREHPLSRSWQALGPFAFSPDGKTFAAWNSVTLGTCLWDVASGKQRASPAIAGRHVVAFSPDGKTLASGHMLNHGGPVILWDLSQIP